MIADKEYIQRVLEIGKFGGLIEVDDYYVRVKYDDFTILLRPEENRIDFWVQSDCVYVAVPLPHPDYKSAFLSKSIRWIFCKLLEELTANYKIIGS